MTTRPSQETGKLAAWLSVLVTLLMASMIAVADDDRDDNDDGDDGCPLATGTFDPQAGASNKVTTCSVRNALYLVEQGRIVKLGRDYEDGMPLFGARTYVLEQVVPPAPAGEEDDPRPSVGPLGTNLLIGNEGFVATEIGQVGTQFDGLGHIGRGTGPDPRFGHYYLGLRVDEVNATAADPEGGLRQLGIEHVKPIITRGVLLNVAPQGTSECNGQTCLDAGHEITLEMVKRTLRWNKLRIRHGDAVFFNTGWGNLWMVDNDRFNSGVPGIGLEVAKWLVKKGVVVVGADTWPVEVVPNPDPNVAFPVHQLFITDNGIFLHENLTFDELIEAGVHEFVYSFVPVPFKGGTGSPGSPIALF